MRLLAGLLLLFSFLLAEPQDEPMVFGQEPEVVQKVLYQSYVNIPDRVFKDQIFSITVKTLSTIEQFDDIVYEFSQGSGVKLLSEEPERDIQGRYYYDTFYFLATSKWIRTPDITASLLLDGPYGAQSALLEGKSIDVVTLNPDSEYANILANDFEVTNYKTTNYNRTSNIVVFSARASRCNIETFHIKNVKKQGIESIDSSYDISTLTYYAVIPKRVENFKFTYFNLKTERFATALIPIIVDDDSVSTQSDLKPTEHRHTMIKIAVAAAVVLLGLILLIIYKKYLFLLLIIIPILYIAYAAVPITYACIKPSSNIYLLPMENGTIFETTKGQYTLEVQGNIKGYTKVKLENDKIGWIKNEDLCTP